MVSTATKVGQFTFSNCLMNAAGVHCGKSLLPTYPDALTGIPK